MVKLVKEKEAQNKERKIYMEKRSRKGRAWEGGKLGNQRTQRRRKALRAQRKALRKSKSAAHKWKWRNWLGENKGLKRVASKNAGN